MTKGVNQLDGSLLESTKMPPASSNNIDASEVFCIVNGKKTDSLIHETWMAEVEESEAYRMTSYNAAIRAGVSPQCAARVFLKPGDALYDLEVLKEPETPPDI